MDGEKLILEESRHPVILGYLIEYKYDLYDITLSCFIMYCAYMLRYLTRLYKHRWCTNEWAWWIGGMIPTGENRRMREIKEKVFHSHFLHYKCCMDWSGIELEPPQRQPEAWHRHYYLVFSTHPDHPNPQRRERTGKYGGHFCKTVYTSLCVYFLQPRLSASWDKSQEALSHLGSCSGRFCSELLLVVGATHWKFGFRSVRLSISWQKLSRDFVPRKNVIKWPPCCLLADCPWSLIFI